MYTIRSYCWSTQAKIWELKWRRFFENIKIYNFMLLNLTFLNCVFISEQFENHLNRWEYIRLVEKKIERPFKRDTTLPTMIINSFGVKYTPLWAKVIKICISFDRSEIGWILLEVETWVMLYTVKIHGEDNIWFKKFKDKSVKLEFCPKGQLINSIA